MGYLIPEYGLDRRHRDLQDDAYYHDGSLITERGRFNLVAYLQIDPAKISTSRTVIDFIIYITNIRTNIRTP